jgi:hypothetical protein
MFSKGIVCGGNLGSFRKQGGPKQYEYFRSSPPRKKRNGINKTLLSLSHFLLNLLFNTVTSHRLPHYMHFSSEISTADKD